MKTNHNAPMDFQLHPGEPLVGRIVCHWHREPFSRQLRDTGRIVSADLSGSTPRAQVEWQSGRCSTLPLSNLMAFDKIAAAVAGEASPAQAPEGKSLAEVVRELDLASAEMLRAIVER